MASLRHHAAQNRLHPRGVAALVLTRGAAALVVTVGMVAAAMAPARAAAAVQPATPPSVPAAAVAPPKPVAPVFHPKDRAVSTWRQEAAANLDLTPDAAVALLAGREANAVARCVKLNNYWCIKKAGWAGEIAADGEGHVAFASAAEGAAVAALLLKRYYVDFDRRTALAIIARWAPAQCGFAGAPQRSTAGLARAGLGRTLRARWLATHARGFVTPVAKGARVRRSVVADHVSKMMPAPSIALGLNDKGSNAKGSNVKGLGEARLSRPITLDALLQGDPNAPRSRSLLGSPDRAGLPAPSCAGDATRVASYAVKAAAGIATGADGDLALFDAAGIPTGNLAIMMGNMARVEIGPLAATSALIHTGIVDAFRPGRNPS